MLGGYLEADDLASARLVSQQWREQLSAQVTDIQLPAHLWQYCVPGQLVTLYRLLDSFKHVQQVRLRIVPQHPVDSWSIGRAMDTLRLALPTLQTVELASVTQAGHWRAVLVSMQCFTQQLTNLRLQDICWPPPDALHLISAFTSLQRLEIASPHFSRLEPAHVEAIGQLRRLRELHLCFRTVAGTANTPLGLDPLSSLVRLTQLNVQYTGVLIRSGVFGSRVHVVVVLHTVLAVCMSGKASSGTARCFATHTHCQHCVHTTTRLWLAAASDVSANGSYLTVVCTCCCC